MILPRIIPVLLIRNNGLYKTIKFMNPKYLGDPMNAVKVFNEKEVDELIFLDYLATIENRTPDLNLIENLANQCFMPVCYGGGIRSVEDIQKIINLGIEKISLNTIASENPAFVEKAAKLFGSSTIVVSIDAKRSSLGNYNVYSRSGQKLLKTKPDTFAKQMEECGAGEILINSISRDGMMQGYDLDLIKYVSKAVTIPIISSGGAGAIDHFREAHENGASAMAAGSFFVFHGKHRGVLISYPSQEDIKNLFS